MPFADWPKQEPLAPSEIIDLYERGYAGAKHSLKEDQKFRDWVRQSGGWAYARQAMSQHGLAGSGAGKLVTPFQCIDKVFPGSLPGPAQEVGDCFLPGTLVRMADGSEKPIEDVESGEHVMSHRGVPRRVTDTIEKDYSGDIVTLSVKGHVRQVQATPDHRFVTYPGLGNFEKHRREGRSERTEWKPVGELDTDDMVLIPRFGGDIETVYDLFDSPSGYTAKSDVRRTPPSDENKVRWKGGWSECERFIPLTPELGSAVEVKSVEQSRYEGKVHCLEVEYDNSFIAEGFAVHNCVSHSTKNAALLTLCCEIEAGTPDQVTGLLEGVPDVSPKGIKEGVLSTEAVYWYRRHSSHGWFCPASVKVMCSESGCWLRKDYPELGIDLTEYSGRLASKYGRRPPGEEITSVGKKHLVRTSTECTGDFEAIRDLLANGYGVTSCGSEGFANSRDENGVARRKGSWAHAMCYLAADDRPEIKDKYGEPLVLVQNSWGVWNTGPTKILGTNIDIPPGSFWARWSDVKKRGAYALSSINGWPRKKLPDYGGSLVG